MQSDLDISSENKKTVLHGFTDYGPTIDSLAVAYKERKKHELATKVLQFIYNGISGFKFTVCHYAVTGMDMRQLRHIIEEVTAALAKYNFQVQCLSFTLLFY